MKVKCIKNDGCEDFLTIGKTYESEVIESDNYYKIIDNSNYTWWFPKYFFKKVSKSNKQKQ